MKQLVLVKPGGRAGLFGSLTGLSGLTPPLDIGILAAYMRDRGFSVAVIDADVEGLSPEQTADRIIEYGPRMAGFFVHTIRMPHAAMTARLLKKRAPGLPVLFGGRHPTALPEKTLNEEITDYICVGEAYKPLLELLERLQNGRSTDAGEGIPGIWYKKQNRLINQGRAPLIDDLNELPYGAWDLMPMSRYRAHNWHCFDTPHIRSPYAIIYTSLGCPYHCDYCCVNTVYGSGKIRYRDPEHVAEELDMLITDYGVKYVRIADDIFTLKRDRVLKLCGLIAEKNYDINMWCYSRVDTVDEELLAQMRKSGITWICYGIEAGSTASREGVSKNLGADTIDKAIEWTRKAGLHIIANFIFGLPDDDHDSMRATLDMAKHYNFEYVNFYTAMAWPGSKLYEDAVQSGLRLPDTWSGYAQLSEDTLPLPTKHLTAREVLAFRDKAFDEYYSNPAYLFMIEQKFGQDIVASIKSMLDKKITRKHLSA